MMLPLAHSIVTTNNSVVTQSCHHKCDALLQHGMQNQKSGQMFCRNFSSRATHMEGVMAKVVEGQDWGKGS
eukprot:scaffold102279_cov12-Tisochrysis_lutea.AAC.1